jgi:hypothetical protein
MRIHPRTVAWILASAAVGVSIVVGIIPRLQAQEQRRLIAALNDIAAIAEQRESGIFIVNESRAGEFVIQAVREPVGTVVLVKPHGTIHGYVRFNESHPEAAPFGSLDLVKTPEPFRDGWCTWQFYRPKLPPGFDVALGR